MNIFKKEMTDYEINLYMDLSDQMDVVIGSIMMANTLKELNPKLETVFDNAESRAELIRAMSYLSTAIINHKNLSHISKVNLLEAWSRANIEDNQYESIFDKSAVAASTSLMSFALQIEWIDSIKRDYKKKYSSLWARFERIAQMLADVLVDYFSSNMEPIKEISPAYYREYVLKRMIKKYQ